MGFLDRLRGKPTSSTQDALTLHAAGTVHVVGESYRQPTLERVALFGTSTAEPFIADLTRARPARSPVATRNAGSRLR